VAEKVLRSVDDLGLLRFGGLFSQQQRNAWGLQALLAGYFGASVEIRQFRASGCRSKFRTRRSSTTMATAPSAATSSPAIASGRAGKNPRAPRSDALRSVHRIPPRSFPRAAEESDLSDVATDQALCRPELDADVQLVLVAQDVPQCQLTDDPALGPRLGWNCWTLSGAASNDVDDAIFEAEAVVRLAS